MPREIPMEFLHYSFNRPTPEPIVRIEITGPKLCPQVEKRAPFRSTHELSHFFPDPLSYSSAFVCGRRRALKVVVLVVIPADFFFQSEDSFFQKNDFFLLIFKFHFQNDFQNDFQSDFHSTQKIRRI
jgi:hypothetical protein